MEELKVGLQFFGILLAFFTTVGLFLFKHRYDSTKEHLTNDFDNSKNVYINQLNYQPKENKKTPYKTNLALVLNIIDDFFGKKLFSLQAFDRYLTFTFIYSFLLFYIVWFLGAKGDIGDIAFLEDLI